MNSVKYRAILKTCLCLKENWDWEDIFSLPYKTKNQIRTGVAAEQRYRAEKGQISLDLTTDPHAV